MNSQMSSLMEENGRLKSENFALKDSKERKAPKVTNVKVVQVDQEYYSFLKEILLRKIQEQEAQILGVLKFSNARQLQ